MRKGYVEYKLPFCGPFVCWEPESNSNKYFSEVILWECMPYSCRKSVEATICLICILSVFTTIFNLVVIAANLMPSTRRVLGRSPTMQNYSNYVISLALADLLIGIVVMPLAIVFFYQEIYSARVATAINQTLLDGWTNKNQTKMSSSFYHFPLQSLSGIYVRKFENLQNDSKSEYPIPGSKTDGSESLLHLLGFFMHFSILISVFTLGAASADRFYVSTKPLRTRGIRFSRVSLRRLRFHPKCNTESCLTLDASRSTLIVVLIWLIGLFLALSPFFLSKNQYQNVGHLFAAVVANDDNSAMFLWYVAALALPLAVIWFFSFLLWLTLWQRKRRLKRFSQSVSKQELRDKKKTDKEADSSFAFISRCSNTEAGAAISVVRNSSSSDHNTTTQSRESSLLETVSNQEVDFDTSECNQFLPRPKLAQSVSLPCSRRRRRPSSLDSSLVVSRSNDNKEENEEEQRNHSKQFLKCYSAEESLPAGYVAKRILLRRSWEGPNSDSKNLSNSSISKTSDASEGSVASKASIVSSPSTPSLSSSRKSVVMRRVRTTPCRVRRQSSIFRAREFIMSNSFESNIARTLFAVVVVFTIAILPLLIVMLQLTPLQQASFESRSKDLTSLVVAVAILLSNSFWNCFIYGVRMPYFRSAIARAFRKFFRSYREESCRELLPRKLNLIHSLRRNSEFAETTK